MYKRGRRTKEQNPDPEKVRKGKGAWAKGNHRVSAVMTTLSKFGYRIVKASASGRSSKRSIAENRISGDFLAMAPRGAGLPHLCCEVGGRKSVVAEIRKMGEMPEGTIPLVVMFLNGKRWYYLDSDERFDKVDEALDAMRSGSSEAWVSGERENAKPRSTTPIAIAAPVRTKKPRRKLASRPGLIAFDFS